MTNYKLLWDCFLSEQMNFLELQKHMVDDVSFAAFVETRVKTPAAKATALSA